MRVDALPVGDDHAGRFDPARFSPGFAFVTDRYGREHAVLSDGYRRLRIDVEDGSLAAGHPVLLRYRLAGIVGEGTEARLLPLRRLAGLYRTGRFLPALFPPDPRVERSLMTLRVHDALMAGASHREIAIALFGAKRIPVDWRSATDSLRSRVRRLVRDARGLANGGYRKLFRRPPPEEG